MTRHTHTVAAWITIANDLTNDGDGAFAWHVLPFIAGRNGLDLVNIDVSDVDEEPLRSAVMRCEKTLGGPGQVLALDASAMPIPDDGQLVTQGDVGAELCALVPVIQETYCTPPGMADFTDEEVSAWHERAESLAYAQWSRFRWVADLALATPWLTEEDADLYRTIAFAWKDLAYHLGSASADEPANHHFWLTLTYKGCALRDFITTIFCHEDDE